MEKYGLKAKRFSTQCTALGTGGGCVCMCISAWVCVVTDMTTGHEVKDAKSQVEPKISPKLLSASPQAEPMISELLGGRHSTEGWGGGGG